jgi:hypothetical protein
MACAGVVALGFLTAALAAVPAESPTARAEEHVRKACAVVWANAAPYQIERCTDRAMAALGEDELARYSELQRTLKESESELQTCKAELKQLQSDPSGTKVSRKQPDNPTER